MPLWGRMCKLEIYPAGTTPQEVPGKEPTLEYFYDGSPNAHEIDFRIESQYSDQVRLRSLEKMAVAETARFVLYNVNIEEELEPGIVIRFQSGYRLFDPGLKTAFVGVVRSVPPIRWRGPNRLVTIVADNGLTTDAKGWLGRVVKSEDGEKLGRIFERSWDVLNNQYEDTDPFFSVDIARKLTEEIAEATFRAGNLQTSDPTDALLRFAFNAASPTGVLEVGGPQAPFTVPLVPEVAAPAAQLQRRIFQLSEGLHQSWLDRGLTVDDLSRKGMKHIKPFRAEGTVWDSLVKLSDKADAPVPIFHAGDLFWNPRPENSTMKITAAGGDLVTLTNRDDSNASPSRVPGILKRVEAERPPTGGGNAGQSRPDSARVGIPKATVTIPSVHLPDVFAGSVFDIDIEPQTVIGFENLDVPERAFQSPVQARRVVHEGSSRGETWTTTTEARLLEA